MSASFNLVVLAGNLTRDVESKTLNSGTQVANTCMAINRKFKGEEQATTFVDIVFFGKTAELAAAYSRKGSNIQVQGRLEQDNWTDKESGAKRSKLKVIADQLVFLDKKGEGGGSQSSQGSYEPPSQEPSQSSDDVPF